MQTKSISHFGPRWLLLRKALYHFICIQCIIRIFVVQNGTDAEAVQFLQPCLTIKNHCNFYEIFIV